MARFLLVQGAGGAQGMAPRSLSLLLVLLCAFGLAISVELTRIHVFVHTDPTYHSVCAMSEGVNCETVAASPYSVFAGLPVAVWGIIGYLIMGGLALWGWSNRRLHPRWPLGKGWTHVSVMETESQPCRTLREQ